MKTTHETTADKRVIIKVIFDRESPEADSPTIETVFQVHFSESFDVSDSDIRILFLLSSTRTDTREPISLTDEELQAVMREAGKHAAEMTENWI